MLLAPDCLFFDGSSVNFKVMIDLAFLFTSEVFVNYVDCSRFSFILYKDRDQWNPKKKVKNYVLFFRFILIPVQNIKLLL